MIEKLKTFLSKTPLLVIINLLSIFLLILLILIIEILFSNFNLAPMNLKYAFGVITVIMVLSIPYNNINMDKSDKLKVNVLNILMLIFLVIYLFKYF